MKKIFFLIFVLLTGLISNIDLAAQDSPTTSLLTESFSERLLTLHRGQLNIASGYEFSVLNKKYTKSGDVILLREDGSAAVKHLVPFRVDFGLLEYLQLSAGINYASSGLRSRNRTIYGYDTFLDIYELTEIKGPDQLSLEIIFRAPTGFKHLDFSIAGGINIPVSEHQPGKPDHTYLESNGSAILNYHYFEKFSTGVKSAQVGATLKYRDPKFSFLAGYIFGSGLGDGKNIHWNSFLNLGTFEYTSQEYNFNIGQYSTWEGIASYQPLKWFNFQALFNGYKSENGWSNLSGLKVGYPEMSVIYGGLGYEIQITPHIRLSQQLRLPVAGKSYSASNIFTTGIIFNFISEGYHNMF